MSWFAVQGKVPDTNRVVQVQGVMTAEATWNADKQTWELTENSKINCEVVQWKEIDNGSTEGQPICQGTDQS